MYYLIGDIHGYFNKLAALFVKLGPLLGPDDTLVFLGDYIDRGKSSFEVIEFLTGLSQRYHTVFLKGNHEDSLLKYLMDRESGANFLYNGGMATINSYKKHMGEFVIPPHHRDFLDGLKLYFETEDFIAVHAGLNPGCASLDAQEEFDLLWIRDAFFRANRRWEKTVIFGHTPVVLLKNEELVYHDRERNIIGIDSGVIFGKPLVCLRRPDNTIFTSD